MKIWNTDNICGTVYYNTDCDVLGILLQSIYYHDNNMSNENHSNWEYLNIKSLVLNTLREYKNHMTIDPVVLEQRQYCSHLTNDMDNRVENWEMIFDFCLHDAAVYATHQAAKTNGREAEPYAQLACKLWQYSRQLRQNTNGRK